MRFSTLILAATVMTAVHALTPNQIVSLLNNIEETTISATALLKDAKASSQSSDAVPKMNVSSSNETDEGHNADRTEQAALEAVSHVATLYDDLNSELQTDLVGGEEDALNSADVARLNAAANNNAQTITPLGDALVDVLVPAKAMNLYRDACEEGINIGVTIITSYSELATRYPTCSITLVGGGAGGVVGVPIDKFQAVGCFFPVEIPGFP
ncbi:hypothetical protein HWV62_15377 [Athelia sp. TMB]|nr:hypothetical protein HWV62_15377 [Athelia sp. TMB]